MKVFIASDHAGFALKQALIPYIRSLGHEVEDKGAYELNPDDDYPDFITSCAEIVAEGSAGGEAARVFGIIIGKSGQGEAMAANRVKGVRAAVFYGGNADIPKLAREHNDANVLSLGAGFLSGEDARAAVAAFLQTPFSNEVRHTRRIAKF